MVHNLYQSLLLNHLLIKNLFGFIKKSSILSEAKLTGTNPIDMVKSLITPDGLKLNLRNTILFNRTRKKTSYIGYRITSELNPYIDHMLVE